MEKLTQRQEKFTRLIFQGVSQYDAYKQAGYKITARSTIDAAASRLANNVKILARLDQFNERVDKKAIYTVEQRKQRLTEIAEEPVKIPVTAKEVVMSIGELNKMDHIYTEPVQGDRVIVQTSIFILPDGQRLTAKQLKEGEEDAIQR